MIELIKMINKYKGTKYATIINDVLNILNINDFFLESSEI